VNFGSATERLFTNASLTASFSSGMSVGIADTATTVAPEPLLRGK
jgi:hypothetical protein